MELKNLAPLFDAASAGFTAVGRMREADSYRKTGELEAQIYDQNANTAVGVSQRKAADERRKARLLGSRAQAVAAASGAGVSDPTVENIIGGIAEEGELRALNELYAGAETARGMRMQSDVAKFEGESYAKATKIKAFNALSTSGMSMFDKYADPEDKKKYEDELPADLIDRPMTRRKGY